MKSNWNYPTTVWVGKNRVNDLVNACLILKIKKYEIKLELSNNYLGRRE